MCEQSVFTCVLTQQQQQHKESCIHTQFQYWRVGENSKRCAKWEKKKRIVTEQGIYSSHIDRFRLCQERVREKGRGRGRKEGKLFCSKLSQLPSKWVYMSCPPPSPWLSRFFLTSFFSTSCEMLLVLGIRIYSVSYPFNQSRNTKEISRFEGWQAMMLSSIAFYYSFIWRRRVERRDS